MSYYEDWIEYDYEYEDEYRRIEDEARIGVWTTRAGEKIPVSEMTTSHISNTIRFLERKDINDLMMPWIIRFKKELERREE
jgi:hypothetical protein